MNDERRKSRRLQWTPPFSRASLTFLECTIDGHARFAIDVTEPVGGVVKWRLHDLLYGVTTPCRTLQDCKAEARKRVNAP